MNIDQAHKKVLKDTEKLLDLVQKEQLKRIKERTPVESGNARNGWEIKGDDIVNDVDYVKYLEYGTRNTAPVAMARRTALETDAIIRQENRKIK